MVAHWRRQRGPGWKWKAAINGLGATITATVALVVAVTKFAAGQEMFRINGFPIHAGAWMVMVVVPVTILGLIAIERHYSRSGTELQTETPLSPYDIHHTIIVPIAQVNRVALQSLAYARSITPNVTAVHIAENAEEAERWRLDWVKYEGYGRLEVIVSPYRSLVSPILSFIDAVDRKQSGDTLTIILPEFVAKHWWERALHNQIALRLKTALLFRPGTVVTNVPYHLRD